MIFNKFIKQSISVNVSFLLLSQPMLMAGEIVTDTSAAKSYQATVEKAQNNVPVVNIVAPNSTGLSHNKFVDYNVNKEGAILNNSNTREVNTQLAGYIYGNKNLAGGKTASTILNEVTSVNKTELKGFTEVAGDKASVVVANPNGIYINGAGFINTTKATLTTGNPNIKDGSIDNYRVDKGIIEVAGDGLNTTNVDKAELYSKVVTLNAKIHAKDIDVVTGKNVISKDGVVQKIDEADNEKPLVSIDSSSLGGIYANKISLIGTQSGVGVNLPIEITAQDDFKLSADGKITLDKVMSQKSIDIKSNSSDVTSNNIYGNNVKIEAKNELSNNYIIASKIDLNLKATKIVNNNLIASGVNESLQDANNGNLNITSDYLENKNTIYAKDDLTISSKDIKNSKSAINKATNINITSTDITNEDEVTLEAKNSIIVNNTNNIISNKSKINALNGNLQLNSKNIEFKNSQLYVKNNFLITNLNNADLEDSLIQANKISISSDSLIFSKEKNSQTANESKVISASTLDINANSILNVNGYLASNGNLVINSKDINNSSGSIVTNADLIVNQTTPTSGTFVNTYGIVQSSNNIALRLFNYNGANSNIQGKDVNISVNDFIASNSNILATQNDLTINALGDINLGRDSKTTDVTVWNIAGVNNVNIKGVNVNLNNTKVLAQNGNFTLNSTALTSKNSEITTSKDLSLISAQTMDLEDSLIQANKISISSDSLIFSKEKNSQTANESKVISASTLDINANSILNVNGYLASNGNLVINSKDINNSSGSIVTNADLIVNQTTPTSGTFVNTYGIVQSSNNIALRLFNYNGANSNIQGKDVNISVNDFIANNSNILATAGNLNINSNTNIDLSNSSQIAALNDVTMSGSTISLNGTKTFSQDGNLTLNSTVLNSRNSDLRAGSNLIIKGINTNSSSQTADLEDSTIQANKIDIKADSLILSSADDANKNIDSTIKSASTLDITANNILNVNGYIGAIGNITINSKDMDNTSGTIVTNADLTINQATPTSGVFNNASGLISVLGNVALKFFTINANDSQIQGKDINISSNSLSVDNLTAIATTNNLAFNTIGDINLSNSYLEVKKGVLNLNANQSSIVLTNSASIGNDIVLNANSIQTVGITPSSNNMLYSLNNININSNSYVAQNFMIQAFNDINIVSPTINLNNTQIQSVALIGSQYTNGYKQGNINLSTSNLTIENASKLASKDLNISNVNNSKLDKLIVSSSILDVNNDMTILANVFNSLASKFSTVRNFTLQTNSLKDSSSNVIFANNSFTSGNNMQISLNDDLTLSNINSFNTLGDFILSVKSLANNAQLKAKRSITINANNYIVNNALISSEGNLTLNATNYITNNDYVPNVNESFGIRAKNTTLNTNSLSNYGFISALNNLTVNANDIVNYAGMAVVDLQNENVPSVMILNANNLTNYNMLFTNGDINLNIGNQLLNKTDNSVVNLGSNTATIYATNNINIGSSVLRTSSIINDKALIQTQNENINIFANSLENKNDEAIRELKDNGSASYNMYPDASHLFTQYTYNAYEEAIIYSIGESEVISKLQQEDVSKGIYYNKIGLGNCGTNIFGGAITNNCFNTDTNTAVINNIAYNNNEFTYKVETISDGYDNTITTWYINYKDRSSNANNLEKYTYDVAVDRVLSELENKYKSFASVMIPKYQEAQKYNTIFLKPAYYYLDIIDGNYYRSNATRYIFSNTSKIDYFTNTPDILKGGKLYSGRNINLNVTQVDNSLSSISAKDNINFTNTSLNNQSETLYLYNELTGSYEYCYKQCSSRWHSPDYTWADLPIKQSQTKVDSLDSVIEAGGVISGTLTQLNNENKARAGVQNIEFTTYTPNKDTKVSTTNIQSGIKETNNTSSLVKTVTTSSVSNIENGTLTSNTTKSVENINSGTVSANSKKSVDSVKSGSVKGDSLETIQTQSSTDIKNISDTNSQIPSTNKKELASDNNIKPINPSPIDETYKLPTNKYGMFTPTDPNKNLNYLVESNPLYTNLTNFTGSQYFLDKLNYKADRIVKKLGDAAYETSLVRDSIVKQTGGRFLVDYASENAQFVALMDNAVNVSGILGLQFGKAPSAEQLSNLKENIVWMEEKIVENQIVLVPVVYLANNYDYEKGAIITAQKGIELKVKDAINNTGTIKSNDYITLTGKSITNNQGVILADGKTSLISSDDFINKNGGLIKGGDVQIASINGNVINQTFAQTSKVQIGSNDFTYTLVGKESSIQSTNGNLVLQANKNIENIGADLSASKTLSLNAQTGDVNFKTLSLENGHNVYFKGGFDKALDVQHLSSSASGENVVIKSGNDINLEAAKLNATNQINLNAANDVNVLAVNDIHYKDVQTSSKGTFSKSTTRNMTYNEDVVSSELNAKDIVINGKNDVTLQSAKLNAQDNLIANAENGNLNVVAKEYKEGELHSTSKSSFGGLSKSLDVSSSDAIKLKSSDLITTNKNSNVVLTSGKDINVLASNINSGGNINLKAVDNVNISSQAQYDKKEEVHEKSSFNLAGLTALVGGNQSIYTQEVHNKDNANVTQISSNLNAGGNIVVNSGTTNIIGSNLEANNIAIKADTGSINVLNTTDTQNNSSL